VPPRGASFGVVAKNAPNKRRVLGEKERAPSQGLGKSNLQLSCSAPVLVHENLRATAANDRKVKTWWFSLGGGGGRS